MQVLQIIAYLAINGFQVVNHAVTGTGSESFGHAISQYFGLVFMNLILVGLIISLAHKSYEMIFETADNVMRWVGFGSRPLGEAQGEQATSRMYGGAAIYSRDAAGAAAAKSGDPKSPYPDPGGHQTHNRNNPGGGDINGGGGGTGGNRGGNTPGGNTPDGNTPGGNTPGGNTPGGDQSQAPLQGGDGGGNGGGTRGKD